MGRARLWAALWPPRLSRAQLVVGVLLAVLGAAVAIQVRSNTIDAQLRDARPDDLVNILDQLAQKSQQYQQEAQTLQSRRDELANSNDRSQAALRDAQQQASTLGILAGTEKATGPGIVLTIQDTARQVKAAQVLDTLEELRAAGAEVIQINNVRVVTATYVVDGAPGQVVVDGTTLSAPYTFRAIGAPADLQRALNIPGGAIPTLRSAGATVSLAQSPSVLIDATVVPGDPRFARSTP